MAATATRKMSVIAFAVLSVLGMVVEYGVGYANNFVYGLGGILWLYAIAVIILFGVGFFGFRKNPDSGLYRALMTFFAAGLLSIIGVVAAYFVLRGRKAL